MWLGIANGWTGSYITDSIVRDSSGGWKGGIVTRNVTVKRISEDAFSDSALCVNCTVESMDRSGTTYHPDVVQFYSRRTQMIIYGLTATVAGRHSAMLAVRWTSPQEPTPPR